MAARHVFTGRRHGDLRSTAEPGALTRARLDVPGVPAAEWTWVDQVHGATVVVASTPGERAGARADAVVTTEPAVPIAVQTADCAPLLIEAHGGVAVVHAGWRGLLAGVVGSTFAVLRDLGLTPERAVLGPTIRPRCYEFAGSDLEPLVERFGPEARSTTGWGTTALDLPAAVRAAVSEHGLALDDVGTCTACSPDHWSHRARGDRERQALVAWLDG
ncbi:MAG: polyphenol oxidase family protein [Acidimicrobiales bacterium]|nr:polyphenol oxidase family protein [Acidimicrobiales bacterium]